MNGPCARRASRALAAVAAATLALAANAAPIRVGTTHNSSDAPLFIAQSRGYFRQEGLDVRFTSFDSTARMIAPLGNGQLEVGAGLPAAGFFNAAARGLVIKMVADKGSMPPGNGYLALLVRKDLVDGGRYRSFADFKGMKVALPAQGTTTDGTLNQALKRGGLKWSDVEVTYLAFAQHVVAFRNKAIDASVTAEPWATRAEQLGVARRVAGGDEVFPYQQVGVILYGGKFIQDRPEEGRRFMKAYLRAVRDYNDVLVKGRLAGPGADQVIRILTAETTIRDASVYKAIVANGCDPDGRLNVDSLKKELQFFRDRNLVQGDVTVDQVIDPSFVDAAVEALGPYERRH